MEDVYQAALETLKSTNRDDYLCALLAPSDKVAHLGGLYAFNSELARLSGLVSEPMLGEIRLQWWRDALASAMNGKPSGNPVMDSFGKTIQIFDLPKFEIEGLIDARSFDISRTQMPDQQALKSYFEKTTVAVVRLSLIILTGRTGSVPDDIIQKAGYAIGYNQVMVRLPQDLSREQIFIPLATCPEFSAQLQNLTKNEPVPDVSDIYRAVTDEVRQLLKEVKLQTRSMPRPAHYAFLKLALIEPYLQIMEHPSFNTLREVPDLNPLKRFWCLWRAAKFRQF